MIGNEPESTAKSTIRATDGREALAQIIAAALNNDDAAIELQNMITLERDGDREVLLAEIIPSPNDLRSSSPLFGSLQGSFGGVRSLRAIDHPLNLANYPTFESFAEALIAIDPLVQVAVAGPDNENTQVDKDFSQRDVDLSAITIPFSKGDDEIGGKLIHHNDPCYGGKRYFVSGASFEFWIDIVPPQPAGNN